MTFLSNIHRTGNIHDLYIWLLYMVTYIAVILITET